MNKCIVNGQLISRDAASISLSDLGATRGFGLFDFFRAFGDRALYLQDHLDRLFGGLKRMGITIEQSPESLASSIHELLQVNAVDGFSGIRILVTGGNAGGFSLKNPSVIVTQEKITSPPEKAYALGATLLLDEYLRELPAVKSTNYMHAVLRNEDMQSEGALDLLYHNNRIITECARSNFFMVKSGTIFTPDLNVLHGITRRRIIELARENYDTRIQKIALEDLMDADEVFITSTIKRVLPVSQVVGIDRSWEVGAVTLDMMRLLENRDSQEIGN